MSEMTLASHDDAAVGRTALRKINLRVLPFLFS